MAEDNPVLKMYEAQAIAIEKEMEADKLKEEVDKLKKEKEELIELMKQLGKNQGAVEKLEQTSSKSLDDVWAAINELKIQYENSQERIRADMKLLQDKMEENRTETWKAVEELRKESFEINNRLNQTTSVVNRLEMQENTILLMGGSSDGETVRDEMLILSSDRSKWIKLDLELPHATYCNGAIYLNGEIYLFGGLNNPRELYKLDKNLNWIQLADMNVERLLLIDGFLQWNGYIWVFGGTDKKNKPLNTVELYDPTENKWTRMPDMKCARSHAAAAVWNDRFIVSGGYTDGGNGRVIVTNAVERFNPHNSRWMELPDMPESIAAHTLLHYKNKLVSLGGEDKNWRRRCDVWQVDHHGTKWNPLPPMKYPSDSVAAAVLNNEIYAIGGHGKDNKFQDHVQIFNGEQWRDGPSLPYPLGDTAYVVIPQHLADRLCNYRIIS